MKTGLPQVWKEGEVIMAWGPDANTEEELEKLAAAAGYFQQAFPGAEVRNSYDTARLAQVFRIETSEAEGFRDAVLMTAVLDQYPASALAKVLSSWQVAEHLRSAKGKEVIVSSWGVEKMEG
jgi:hypothetical protein